jgi:exonuclease VII small subunit
MTTPISNDQPSRPAPSVTDVNLRLLIAQAVEPLQAEIADLKKQIGTAPAKRSNFEISLTHIPPEVEDKLWQRLHTDLSAQVLQQTNEQSARVLESAKQTVEQTIDKAHGEFRQYLRQELESVEQRAHGLSEEITDSLQQHLNSRVERFHQHVLEAGIHLERRSDDFLKNLQQRLNDDHQGYRHEIKQAQSDAAEESARLQSELVELGSRFRSLDESALRLESGMDAHLTRTANEIIAGARLQLEGAVDVVLKELGTRNAKEIGIQLDEACGKLQSTRKSIEASLTELLRTEITGTLLSFGQTVEELAQESVGRWRNALARDLNSVAQTLGQTFQSGE